MQGQFFFQNTILAVLLLIFHEISGITELPKNIEEQFKNHDELHVMLVLTKEASHVINSINSRRFQDSVEKTTVMVAELEEYTRAAQENVLSFLRRRSPLGVYKPFWITNRISMRQATKPVLIDLIASHGEDIKDIREAVIVSTGDPIVEDPYEKSPQGIQWGLENIQANEAHKKGYNGTNIVVAVMDTGVRSTHEALKYNIRPFYNWFDIFNEYLTPADPFGHGTHCTGIAVGRNGIGVAPGSQYIHCRLLNSQGFGTDEDVLGCAQWVVCPTLADGTGRDCSMKPHVCSNSWGGGQNDDFYNDAILAMRAAKIIPIFAIGNNGPECSTANSPGDQPHLISVGSTKADDWSNFFSSRGPTNSIHPSERYMKPEIAAPGYRINSASNQGDTKYVVYSGTSMATPNVAGSVAVLLSKNPTLDFTQIMNALAETAFQFKTFTFNYNDCIFGNHLSQYPNNAVGHGTVRLSDALEKV